MFYNKCFPLLEELKVIEKNIFPAIINMIDLCLVELNVVKQGKKRVCVFIYAIDTQVHKTYVFFIWFFLVPLNSRCFDIIKLG